jgi:hypothetical protein
MLLRESQRCDVERCRIYYCFYLKPVTFETIKDLGQLFCGKPLSLHLFNLPARSSVKKNLVEHGKLAL